jgi:hypothetical protein
MESMILDLKLAHVPTLPKKTGEIVTGDGTKITLRNPFFDELLEHVKFAAELVRSGRATLLRPDLRRRRRLLVVGPGPSATGPDGRRVIRYLGTRDDHDVLAIKEAIDIVRGHGISVRYSCAMDPGDQQHVKTPIFPEISYLIASSCHPDLFRHTLGRAPVVVYHSACGVTWPEQQLGEMQVYQRHFPEPWFVAEGGYTVVNRAVSCARFMGYDRVTLIGCDFGWREGGDYYAQGVRGKAGNLGADMTDEGRIDGRPWYTRPDMLASACSIAKLVHAGYARVCGDSLAAALAKKSPDFLEQVVRGTV